MKHIRIYEEYTDQDMEDLLSDLSDIGQVEKVRVSCFTQGSSPQEQTHPSWWTSYFETFAITIFADRGSDIANKDFALQKIRRGEFDQKLETDMTEFKNVDPEVLKIMDKKNIQKIALKVSTLDLLLQEVRTELIRSIMNKWEEVHERILNSMKNSYAFEWRSSPRKLRETIEENLESGIKIRKI